MIVIPKNLRHLFSKSIEHSRKTRSTLAEMPITKGRQHREIGNLDGTLGLLIPWLL